MRRPHAGLKIEGGRPLRIAPVVDVPGPVKKNYFFFFEAFLVDFFAAFLVAFFFAAFFAMLNHLLRGCLLDVSTDPGGEARGNNLRPSWLDPFSPPLGRPLRSRSPARCRPAVPPG